MKCEACGKEIALAKVCPYCQTKVSQRDRREEKKESSPRGRFRGPVDESDGSRRGSSTPMPTLSRILRFLVDPRVPGWRKGLVMAVALYVLSPVDLLPGAVFPIVGWFDDVALAVLAWQWIRFETDRLDRRP